jgi:hypothetical protein
MRSTIFLAVALATTSVAARAEGSFLAPHTVQNIQTNVLRAAPVLAESDAGIVAFYETGDCTGTPAFLRMQDQVCYGPISRTASINLITAGEHCESKLHHA